MRLGIERRFFHKIKLYTTMQYTCDKSNMHLCMQKYNHKMWWTNHSRLHVHFVDMKLLRWHWFGRFAASLVSQEQLHSNRLATPVTRHLQDARIRSVCFFKLQHMDRSDCFRREMAGHLYPYRTSAAGCLIVTRSLILMMATCLLLTVRYN